MKLIAASSILLLQAQSASAFMAPHSHSHTHNSITSITSNPKVNNIKLHVSPNEIDIPTTSAALQHFIDTTSTLLSDASAAAADATATATADADGGWWQNYLQLYKNSLLFVHSTIDGPLKNAGWDQTWGISIAIFTASEFMFTIVDTCILCMYMSVFLCVEWLLLSL